MKIDVRNVKSPLDIIGHVLTVLVSRKFKFENDETFSELDAMSGQSIYDLIQKCTMFYLQEIKWIDKKGEKLKSKFCKIPAKINKQMKYLEALYEDCFSYGTEEEKNERLKTSMLEYAWNQILMNDGLSSTLR